LSVFQEGGCGSEVSVYRPTKKLPDLEQLFLMHLFVDVSLFGLNRSHRASVSTSAAVGTGFRVYQVDIARRYCANRTFINTSSTSSAIFTNFVCHTSKILINKVQT
jgi:hypothetical protein